MTICSRKQIPFYRPNLAAMICTLMSILGFSTSVEAQAPMKEKHDDIVLTTAAPENLELHITYFQSDLGKETPVVVLLHGEGASSNRQVWLGKGGFAERLWDQGYAVIAVDLRKHGQSVVKGPGGNNQVGPLDRQAMVSRDMETVKDFIFKEHMAQRLNMNKLGIIAPEMSAAVAILFTIKDWSKQPFNDGRITADGQDSRTPRGQDVRTLILLSPESNARGISVGSQLAAIGQLAANPNAAGEFSMLMLYGTADKKDKRNGTRKMHRVASNLKASKERVLIKSYPFKFRGVELIGPNNPRTKCEEHMLGFLDIHLKKLTQTPWRDRRSVFNRN